MPLDDPGGIDIVPEELAAIRDTLDRKDMTVAAFRFEGDKWCTAQRFAAHAKALVTAHLIDEAGQPTLAARDEILDFLKQRLHALPRTPQRAALESARPCRQAKA